jgi:hypothetical protein
MDARTKNGQRLGLFSYAMPLTVGDSSTNYQKDRRPKEEIGRKKGFVNNRGKSTCSDTFNKLVSNAVGDEYRDPGKYFLRSETKQSNQPFKQSGAQRLVKHSEFMHMKEFDEKRKGPRNMPIGVNARSTSETFQKQYQYVEDAFERKEDMRKLDYQRRAALILDKQQAYTTSVK